MTRYLRVRRCSQRPGLVLWSAAVVGGVALMLIVGRGPLGAVTWSDPPVFFWSVVVAAGLCLIGASGLLVVAWRADLAELGMLGAALWVVSALPLVHGLTAPGYIYGHNAATAISVFLSLPLGAVCALPLLAPGVWWAMSIGRRWKLWVAVNVVLAAGVGTLLLAQPRLFPSPRLADPATVIVAVVAVSALLALSLRQLRLYWIGRSRTSLWASLGFVLIAVAGLVWLDPHAYSTGWWLAHALDTVGVLAAVGFLVTGPRPASSVSEILAPVVARDPLSAFALGLSPVVHRFVAALESKDQTTRDHVVRVGELAMRSGARAGIPARRLRDLGVGALLHDVGKLTTPDEILNARRSLSADEFEIIKEHPLIGEALLRAAPELGGAASFVRWHHERFDGTGYPDGIAGDSLPIEVRIISVVDAFDAMANNRQYRQAMDIEAAVAVLREHAGTQWDPGAVEVVIGEIHRNGIDRHPLWGAGRDMSDCDGTVCEVCLDALPSPGHSPVSIPPLRSAG